jgi:hypothetical protein
MAPAMNRSRRLRRIEGLAEQQERLAEAEGLQALAESTRAKLIKSLEMHRNGGPLPAPVPSEDRDSPARERLRQRLNETGQRLRRYAEMRDIYGIR